METKFFDVEDLRRWRFANENSATMAFTKNSRIVEQISRLFDVPSPSPSQPVRSSSDTQVQTASATPEDNDSIMTDLTPTSSQEQIGVGNSAVAGIGMVLYDLCSVILKKLVEAHNEYENRFGKFKKENCLSPLDDSKDKENCDCDKTENSNGMKNMKITTFRVHIYSLIILL